MRTAFLPHAACAVALALLAACSPDYTGVRDWAFTASGVVEAGARATEADAAASAFRQTTVTYLGALSTLSMDGLLEHETDPLAAAATAVGPSDPEGAAAVAELGELLLRAARQLARAPQLRETIAEADPPFQAMVAAFGRALARLDQADAALLASLRATHRIERQRIRDVATRAAMADLLSTREAEVQHRLARQGAEHAALARIAETHAAMAEQTSVLAQSDMRRRLHAADVALRRYMPPMLP